MFVMAVFTNLAITVGIDSAQSDVDLLGRLLILGYFGMFILCVTSLVLADRPAQSAGYEDVLRLYPYLSLWGKTYCALRFLICPFGRLESVVPRSGRVVSVGDGYGLFANLLAIRSPLRQVVGCDIDAARIEIASSSVGYRKNVSFFVSDHIPTLPPCDVVTMIDLLHHVPPAIRIELLKEVRRKLRPGGCLIIKDVDTHPRAKYLWNYAHDWLMTRGARCYYLGKMEMCNLLQPLGFTVIAEPLQTHTPYAHILYRCTKNEAAVGDDLDFSAMPEEKLAA